jgi:hypothetical protein
LGAEYDAEPDCVNMKVLSAYSKGWLLVIRNKRIWALLYLVNLVLALFAAIPLSGFLGKTIGDSTLLGSSLPGFDYTFIGELLQQYNLQIDRILDQTFFSIFIFLGVSVFLMGGALHLFRQGVAIFDWSDYWLGCRKYFWRLLRLTFYFLIVHTVTLLVFVTIFASMCEGLNPFLMESEKQMLDAFMVLSPIYLIFFTLITMVHDYAKVHLVALDYKWIYKPFLESFRISFKNSGRFIALYCLNIFTFLIAFGLYWWGSSFFEAVDSSAIIMLLLIGQIFIIIRVAIRLLFWSSATYLYQWTRPQYIT